MKFEKSNATIPCCARLEQRYENLNALEHIQNLPTQHENDKKMAVRKKWFLIRKTLERTPALEAWPEMATLLDEFPGKIALAHLSLMVPGTVLPIHRDGISKKGLHRPLFELFEHTLRFHVPLETNEQAKVFAGGRFYQMKVGECWMLNNFENHAAINTHENINRYHLIFDVEPNEDTMKLLQNAEVDLGYEDQALLDTHWPEEQNAPKLGDSPRQAQA